MIKPMKRIGVIAVDGYNRQRLVKSISQRDHQPVVIEPNDLSATVRGANVSLLIRGQQLNLDGFIHIMSTDFLAPLRTLQAADRGLPPFLNSVEAVLRSADKFITGSLLARARLPYPRTYLALNDDDLKYYADTLGYPVVLKQPDGARGEEVALAKSADKLLDVAGSIRGRGMTLMIQEFISESFGRDLRIIVVGNKIVAAMERRSTDAKEFRSNLHRGGAGYQVELTPQEKNIALKTVQTVGLDLAGVDILRSRRGPLVTETNSFPGLEGIERTTGIDVAGEITDLLMARLV